MDSSRFDEMDLSLEFTPPGGVGKTNACFDLYGETSSQKDSENTVKKRHKRRTTLTSVGGCELASLTNTPCASHDEVSGLNDVVKSKRWFDDRGSDCIPSFGLFDHDSFDLDIKFTPPVRERKRKHTRVLSRAWEIPMTKINKRRNKKQLHNDKIHNKEKTIEARSPISIDYDFADDLEPIDYRPGEENEDMGTRLLALEKAMVKSQQTQKKIHEWDKKMGLKKSHSKTMRLSSQSREKALSVIREEIKL